MRAVGPNTQQEGSSLNNEPGSTVDAVDCAFQAVDDRRVKVDPQCLGKVCLLCGEREITGHR
ncbi:hypothetical protein BURCENBC7_AP6678 [Burkholderia cenocepacia BC7]|nr:hypothetical protein BURCENK562V_C1646 [Burkholderia cenocepacia K56-2Valvano]ERI25617.1 hypothetical protein BURCENBC7_AP6678 [Burkholderia cenocepacia BC7]